MPAMTNAKTSNRRSDDRLTPGPRKGAIAAPPIAVQERGNENQQEQERKRPDVQPPRVRGRKRGARQSAQLLSRLQSHDLGTLMPMMPLVRRGAERDSRRLLAGLALGLLFAASAAGQISTDQVGQDEDRFGQGAGPGARPRRIASGWDRSGSPRCCASTMPGTTATSSGFLRLSRWPGIRPPWRADFKWLIPAGSKFYVVGEAIPAYVWYQDLSARSFFGGNYSAYLLGFFNRASLSRSADSIRRPCSTSAPGRTAPVIQTTLDGSIKMDVEVASNFSLYANAEVARLRFGNSDLSGETRGHQRAPAHGGIGGGRGSLPFLIGPERGARL